MSAPDCPRCAALTRERDEAVKRADIRSEETLRFMGASAVEYRGKLDAEVRAEAAERDLAQARQALQRLSDAATTVWHQASVGTGYVTYNALEEIFEANAVAREALVERGTEQTDSGGDPRSPVAEESS